MLHLALGILTTRANTPRLAPRTRIVNRDVDVVCRSIIAPRV